jgi:hypothetical protein
VVDDAAFDLSATRDQEMKSWFLTFVACLIFLGVGWARYWGPGGGIPAVAMDYSTHLNISEHLRHGWLFQEWDRPAAGRHSVSKYLPVYHGILGFHFAALVLESVGIPRPGAYALLMDLSLLSVLLVFFSLLREKIKTGWRWEYGVAAIFIVPVYTVFFTEAALATFYAQLLSQGLLALAYYSWRRKQKAWALAFVAYATFTYPDFMIWLLPVFLAQKTSGRWTLLKIPAALFWLALAIVPLQRALLPGPYVTNLYPLGIAALIWLVFCKELYKNHRGLFITTGVFCAYSAVLLLYKIENMNPSYYAVKLAGFAFLLMPLLLLELPLLSWSRGRILLACTLCLLPWQGELWSKDVVGYISPTHFFNNRLYLEVQDLKKNAVFSAPVAPCLATESFFIMDRLSGDEGFAFKLAAANALLMNSDIAQSDLLHPEMHSFYYTQKGNGSAVSFIRTFQGEEGVSSLLQGLRQKTFSRKICVIAGPETERALEASGLFEVLGHERSWSFLRSR